MSTDHPKLFISYSHSSPDHEEWVLKLATELHENGVDVILDKWDLREGHDAIVFMEKMVSDPKIEKVAIICDRVYAEKADGRSGGVGIETQIITPEIYDKKGQNKFVAIIAERDENGKPYLPTYYKSRIYIDLSNDDLYAQNFERLLRWIYNKPLYEKPQLGKKPSFLDESRISLGTTSKYRRASDAIRNARPHCEGDLIDYFETFINNLEKFRIYERNKQLNERNKQFDDLVIESIEMLQPYIREAIDIFSLLAQYRDTPNSRKILHRFFEDLIPFMFRPQNLMTYREHDFDNYRFVVHELFLYAVTKLLKYECYDFVAHLLDEPYYWDNKIILFSSIYQEMDSLSYRKTRLQLNLISLRADLLKKRAQIYHFSIIDIMQTDFILYIRSCFDYLRLQHTEIRDIWNPETLVYGRNIRHPFKIFQKARSKQYFNMIKCLFRIEKKDEFQQLFHAFAESDPGKKLHLPRWDLFIIDPKQLIGYDQMAVMP